MVRGINLEWENLKEHLDLQNNEKEVKGGDGGGRQPQSDAQVKIELFKVWELVSTL